MAANSGSPGKSGAGIRRYTGFCLKGNAKRKMAKKTSQAGSMANSRSAWHFLHLLIQNYYTEIE
ncbi:hypothetical protein [Herbaspirillum sp.]|uniref:hypothetical protein n=1 Tax=Herbaspirillum sp. TaxID=1890675 RepID=UPI0031DC9EF7